MAEGYDESVERVRSAIGEAEELDGFVFAATSGGEATATIGTNPDAVADPGAVALAGMVLLTVAETQEVHPAVAGHDAIQWAAEQLGNDAPRTIEDHDGGP